MVVRLVFDRRSPSPLAAGAEARALVAILSKYAMCICFPCTHKLGHYRKSVCASGAKSDPSDAISSWTPAPNTPNGSPV